MTVIKFRATNRYSSAWLYRWKYTVTVAVLAFLAIAAFLQTEIDTRAPVSPVAVSISVVDGDTVRADGQTYRLVGFDTPESGSLARCERERKLADAATSRLRQLIANGQPSLEPVPCSCRPGTEGT